MNIYEKMSKATELITKVAKDMTVGKGDNKFKAVSENSVLEAVKPIEVQLGIYSYPISRKVVESKQITSSKTYDGVVKETITFFSRIETIYRFVNIEKPDEFIETTTYGEGIDTQDKGAGKAMTYADKYALLKAYKIETGDDSEGKDVDTSTFGTIKRIRELYAKKASELGGDSFLNKNIGINEKQAKSIFEQMEQIIKFEKALKQI